MGRCAVCLSDVRQGIGCQLRITKKHHASEWCAVLARSPTSCRRWAPRRAGRRSWRASRRSWRRTPAPPSTTTTGAVIPPTHCSCWAPYLLHEGRGYM